MIAKINADVGAVFCVFVEPANSLVVWCHQLVFFWLGALVCFNGFSSILGIEAT